MFSVRLLIPGISLTHVCVDALLGVSYFMGQSIVIVQVNRYFMDQAWMFNCLEILDVMFKELLKLNLMFMLNFVNLLSLSLLEKPMFCYTVLQILNLYVSAETLVSWLTNVLSSNVVFKFLNWSTYDDKWSEFIRMYWLKE